MSFVRNSAGPAQVKQTNRSCYATGRTRIRIWHFEVERKCQIHRKQIEKQTESNSSLEALLLIQESELRGRSWYKLYPTVTRRFKKRTGLPGAYLVANSNWLFVGRLEVLERGKERSVLAIARRCCYLSTVSEQGMIRWAKSGTLQRTCWTRPAWLAVAARRTQALRLTIWFF